MIDVLHLTIGPTRVHARLLIGSGEPRPGATDRCAKSLTFGADGHRKSRRPVQGGVKFSAQRSVIRTKLACCRDAQGRFVFRLRMTRSPPTSRSGTWPTHFRPLRWPLTTLLLPPATRHYSKPFLFVPSGVNPAELRTVKLSSARPIRLFRTACRIVRSSGSVSVCQRTHTARRFAA